ncbi:MAG: pilus assembly protein PilM [Lachnospiraceae bacterium]|nr:pilus assembly protein PilM [Lachnospiraceae bacterium]
MMKKTANKKKENVTFKKTKNVIVLPKKHTMGIDIGSKNIKLAVVKGDRILSAVSEPIPNGVVVDGAIEAPQILVKSLRAARKRLKGSVKKGTLCLSGKDLIMREITLPQMKEDQVLTNIKNELSNIYLLASGDYTIDYRILETINNPFTGEKSMRVLVVSAPKSLISDYIKVCRKAGIKLERIDVLPNAHTKLIRKIINDQEKLKGSEQSADQNSEDDSKKEKKSSKKVKAKLDKKNHKRLKKEKRQADKAAKIEAREEEKRRRSLEEKLRKEREENERELEKKRQKRERALAEAREAAEKAAKEAMERSLKAQEKQSDDNRDSKEIAWYFGRKLNDLDQNLYENEANEVSKTETNEKAVIKITQSIPEKTASIVPQTVSEPEEEMPCNYVLNLDTDNESAEEYVINRQNMNKLSERLSESVSEIIKSDVSTLEKEPEETPFISNSIENYDVVIEEPDDKDSHTYISDEEASNILDSFLNDTLKAKEQENESEHEKKSILENVCLIDIGFTMSNVTFIRNGSYSMHKNIRYGGEYINEAISEKMDLDMNSAEDFKLSKNGDTDGALYEYYDSIISELDNTMYYYKTNNNQNGVDCIVIAGGSSRLGGIKEYFSTQLGVPVFMLSEIADFKTGYKLTKRQKGKNLHFEDYLGAISITLKEEWV